MESFSFFLYGSEINNDSVALLTSGIGLLCSSIFFKAFIRPSLLRVISTAEESAKYSRFRDMQVEED